MTGQTERPKVLKWPNREVIVGYVGQAELDGLPADDWLYSFIGQHLEFNSLQGVAEELTLDLNRLFPTFPGVPMVLHLGGFEMVVGQVTPRIYFIRNTTALSPEGEYVVGTQFECSEEVSSPTYFGSMTGDQIRAAVAWPNYFSFRQGYGLGRFNVIDSALRKAMNTLIQAGMHEYPRTLDELSEHVRFQIYGYGAYFASFFPPLERYVGGGADVVAAAWRCNSAFLPREQLSTTQDDRTRNRRDAAKRLDALRATLDPIGVPVSDLVKEGRRFSE